MINTLLTCEFPDKELRRLESFMRIFKYGWAVSDEIAGGKELVDFINQNNIEVLIVLYTKIDSEVLVNCPSIKVIFSSRKGPGANIDIAKATELGIPVFHIARRNHHFVAELTFGLMISLARNICAANRLLGEREFTQKDEQAVRSDVRWELSRHDKRYELRGVELFEKYLGIIGLGEIGSEVASLGNAFGMNIYAYDPFVDTESETARKNNIRLVPLDELLRNSDFVSLHAKPTRDTIGMIGMKEFRMMKRSAFIVNVARAALIDEQSLYTALKEKVIAGAGLDVFHKEPLDPDNPLLDMPNTVLTPHLGGGGIVGEIWARSARLLTDSILTLRRGETPANFANPEAFVTDATRKEAIVRLLR